MVKNYCKKYDFPSSNDNETKIMGSLREKVFMFHLTYLLHGAESFLRS
jgi:hypothetical protein